MQNTLGKLHHADFVIDTNVLSRTKVDDAKFAQLLGLVKRMTASEQCGDGWFAVTSLQELLATSDPTALMQLLGRLLTLIQAVGDQVHLFAPLPELVAQEWKGDVPLFVERAALEEMIQSSLDTGSIDGTPLGELRDGFLRFKEVQLAEYERGCRDYADKFMNEPRFRAALEAALAGWTAPEAYGHVDDLALRLVEGSVLDPGPEPLEVLKDHEKHLTVWTYALLFRLSQIAQTVPSDQRAAFFGRLGLPSFRPNRNDMIDAGIGACAATCGLLITEDSGLAQRINFLHARHLIRPQAVSVDVLDAQWKAPPPPPPPLTPSPEAPKAES